MFFLILVVCLLFGGLVTLVAALNLTLPVHLDLFSLHTPDLSIGVWLVAAFLFGAVALYLVSMLSALGDRHKMKTLRKQVLALQEQIATLSQGQSQTSSVSTEQKAKDSLSTADTGPLTAMPGAKAPQAPMPGMNPQPSNRRVTLSPLSSQNSRQ